MAEQQLDPHFLDNDHEEWDDRDSALGSDTSSITESLSSSVMAYEYENGRRYHAYEAGRYPVPNDEPEADRLDLQHRVWWLTLHDKLYRAPIDGKSIKKALDIGTGTGIWAIDFADQHPDCHIMGTDLSPIQPSWLPPNCEFMVDDADSERGWDFHDIDYIHSRLLVIGFRGWERYIRRCYDSLVPGGWLELQEAEFPSRCDDDTCPPHDQPGFMEFTTYVRQVGDKTGVDWDCQNKFPHWLQEAGFTNITREEYKWPIGPWMDKEDARLGQIGAYMVPNANLFLEGGGAFFTRHLGWSADEYLVAKAKWKKRLYDEARSKHQYLPVTVHYAQKPFGFSSVSPSNDNNMNTGAEPANTDLSVPQEVIHVEPPNEDALSHFTEETALPPLVKPLEPSHSDHSNATEPSAPDKDPSVSLTELLASTAEQPIATTTTETATSTAADILRPDSETLPSSQVKILPNLEAAKDHSLPSLLKTEDHTRPESDKDIQKASSEPIDSPTLAQAAVTAHPSS